MMLSKTGSIPKTWLAVIGAVFLLCFGLSFYWWAASENRHLVLEVHPGWEESGFVLYDGYGEYAGHLRTLLTGADEAERAAWDDFRRSYIHIYRPVFPALVALVSLLVPNLLISAILVNLASVALLGWVWHRILTRQLGLEGVPLAAAHLVALTHVAVIGMLARPMPDALAMAIILGFLYLLVEARRAFRPWQAAALAGLLVIGIFTKLVAVLLVPVAALALAEAGSGSPAKKALRAAGLLAASGVVVLGLAGLLVMLAPESAAATFLSKSLAGATRTFRELPPGYIKAAIVFLAIGLQFWPVFWLRRESLAEAVVRIHAAWLVFYVAQRLLFYGFSLEHSRARYALPLVFGTLVLAWPAVRAWLGRGQVIALAVVATVANLAVWILLLLRET